MRRQAAPTTSLLILSVIVQPLVFPIAVRSRPGTAQPPCAGGLETGSGGRDSQKGRNTRCSRTDLGQPACAGIRRFSSKRMLWKRCRLPNRIRGGSEQSEEGQGLRGQGYPYSPPRGRTGPVYSERSNRDEYLSLVDARTAAAVPPGQEASDDQEKDDAAKETGDSGGGAKNVFVDTDEYETIREMASEVGVEVPLQREPMTGKDGRASAENQWETETRHKLEEDLQTIAQQQRKATKSKTTKSLIDDYIGQKADTTPPGSSDAESGMAVDTDSMLGGRSDESSLNSPGNLLRDESSTEIMDASTYVGVEKSNRTSGDDEFHSDEEFEEKDEGKPPWADLSVNIPQPFSASDPAPKVNFTSVFLGQDEGQSIGPSDSSTATTERLPTYKEKLKESEAANLNRLIPRRGQPPSKEIVKEMCVPVRLLADEKQDDGIPKLTRKEVHRVVGLFLQCNCDPESKNSEAHRFLRPRLMTTYNFTTLQAEVYMFCTSMSFCKHHAAAMRTMHLDIGHYSLSEEDPEREYIQELIKESEKHGSETSERLARQREGEHNVLKELHERPEIVTGVYGFNPVEIKNFLKMQENESEDPPEPVAEFGAGGYDPDEIPGHMYEATRELADADEIQPHEVEDIRLNARDGMDELIAPDGSISGKLIDDDRDKRMDEKYFNPNEGWKDYFPGDVEEESDHLDMNPFSQNNQANNDNFLANLQNNFGQEDFY
mmetsp:Transcript_29114/g.71025  ORF Transcript_29114/g.71025 Transcript_29114/m.71025 type:complete len:717 (+) Transcript_29114:119-2269(+)